MNMYGFKTVPILRGFTEIAPIYKIIESYGMICGGYPRYMCSERLHPHPASDVDIYFDDFEKFEIVKKLFEQEGLIKKHENHVSYTFEIPKDGLYAHRPAIQLIKPINEGAIVAKGNICEILRNFDFTVVRIGLINPDACIADDDFVNDEKKGVLSLKNIHCPVSSLLRCLKYGRKGYYLRPSQAMKLFADWDNRPEEYRIKLFQAFQKSELGEMTQEDVDELEKLLRID